MASSVLGLPVTADGCPGHSSGSLWIEPRDCGAYLSTHYDIASRNLLWARTSAAESRMQRSSRKDYPPSHVFSDDEGLPQLIHHLLKHIEEERVPVIMDDGLYSYCVAGFRGTAASPQQLLVLDPHQTDASMVSQWVSPKWMAQSPLWMALLPAG
eukprot:CAMPEP_0114558704 /NCGR_PEP_ID=MMETSP0114-20121206/10528_1 /TAXON_ID=31324 /ORGANISM="Goniomonas sp, Strain m" /LENGTH=154 /DNA_ID=CAMNT_0001744121 /DNA_START=201 /DNA_END=661 /DNA_ORIENTATION=-